jgi:undecaprenyl-diphosphatase
MSIPIIGGAGLYKGFDVVREGGVPSEFVGAFVWGTIASGITGFVAIWFLLKLIRSRGFTPFVVYRVLLGLFVIGVAIAR